ncbi:hypothetical protein Ga0074115_1282 [endosymbiont of Ridgeia piscesae]|jgi:hypothetical protein|uniref:Uncharacterized protein n=3 Tax=sulfur-oxidizing symbionts TaxID=32036 RepID=G2FD12_9GAMM|nr:hypothetical protein Rifp1Sym_cn00030 [endosymbiont of Riftia pachyptila (vent Ph05)]EGW55392.1 hypothetical protein TevJSym_ad01260 [endosymbiont of Tevnia jerichonana (vent Tica)]KRT55946.1 hypothetical protein Ga0074115_1282 [endosymbiont of Ridgeia piscesae]KRT57620.1 hypothetical protein Ga0076813_11873 [endosymbiont of Ridgeia piscesae]
MKDMLSLTCEEFREISETNPNEVEIIVEMLIEAEVELCKESS